MCAEDIIARNKEYRDVKTTNPMKIGILAP